MRLVGSSPITYTIDLADFYTVPAPYTRPAYVLFIFILFYSFLSIFISFLNFKYFFVLMNDIQELHFCD